MPIIEMLQPAPAVMEHSGGGVIFVLTVIV